jgi:hypothetical protein
MRPARLETSEPTVCKPCLEHADERTNPASQIRQRREHSKTFRNRGENTPAATVATGKCDRPLEMLAGAIQKWTWTIYIGGGPGEPSRSVEGIPIVGTADTLDQAQQYFKDALERMRGAGVIKPSGRPPA